LNFWLDAIFKRSYKTLLKLIKLIYVITETNNQLLEKTASSLLELKR